MAMRLVVSALDGIGELGGPGRRVTRTRAVAARTSMTRLRKEKTDARKPNGRIVGNIIQQSEVRTRDAPPLEQC